MKRRLVGAFVLVSLAVIFLPMLLEEQQERDVRIEETNIPEQPVVEEDFHSKVLPLPDDEPLIPPLPRQEQEAIVAEQAEPPVNLPVPEETLEPKVGLSAWVVQIASLSNKKNADQLVADLRNNRHSAFIEQVYVNGKNLFRVRVGPEIDRKRAERMAQEIHKAFKLKGQVIRYP